jgi:uncharacterized protein HemX
MKKTTQPTSPAPSYHQAVSDEFAPSPSSPAPPPIDQTPAKTNPPLNPPPAKTKRLLLVVGAILLLVLCLVGWHWYQQQHLLQSEQPTPPEETLAEIVAREDTPFVSSED